MVTALVWTLPLLLAPADSLVVRDVRVLDLDAGNYARVDVVVRDGRIEELAAPGAAAVEDAVVVDGQGAFVLPGLFDMHVHLNDVDGDELLWLYLANGVTQVQSMHGGEHQLSLRERVASGQLAGPRIWTTGPTTAREQVHTVEQATVLVHAQAEAGYDAIKMYGDGQDTMPLETYVHLVRTAHEAGIPVIGHAPRNLPFVVVLESGQKSIDHMEEIVYTDRGLGRLLEPFVAFQFGSGVAPPPGDLETVPDFARELAPEVADLAARVAEAGLTVTPTLSTFKTIQQMTSDELTEVLARDELRYMHPARRETWTPEQNRFRNGGWAANLAFMSRYLQSNVELQMALAKAFHDEGVPILAGTDAPFDCLPQGFGLHRELAMFVAAGLTPIEALRCATTRPASFLGVEGELGRVAAGHHASFVLLGSDPLEDVSNLRDVRGVCVRGTWHDRARLDRELEGIAAGFEAVDAYWPELSAHLEAGEFAEALAGCVERRLLGDRRLATMLEERVNEAGYEHLRAGRVEAAIAMFTLNTDTFPESSNAWDSLAEAHQQGGDQEKARELYERARSLR